jgi:hypothetical protein
MSAEADWRHDSTQAGEGDERRAKRYVEMIWKMTSKSNQVHNNGWYLVGFNSLQVLGEAFQCADTLDLGHIVRSCITELHQSLNLLCIRYLIYASQ